MSNSGPQSVTGRFDIAAIAAKFPEAAETLLIDQYLTNNPHASTRVFRVYKSTPPHYHATCDEHLYVFSGRGTFWMEDPASVAEFGPGQLLHFKRGTVQRAARHFGTTPGVPGHRHTAPRPAGRHLCEPGRRNSRVVCASVVLIPKACSLPPIRVKMLNTTQRRSKPPPPNFDAPWREPRVFMPGAASTPPPCGSNCWRKLKLVIRTRRV